MGPHKTNHSRQMLKPYLAALLLFSLWVLADAFLLEERYQQAPESGQGVSAYEEMDEAVVTENSYQVRGISITVTEHRAYESTIYVADIYLDDIQALKTALAENTYGRNVTQKVAEMAQEQNAALAINGDYYGARRSGYVIRNGTLYRSQSAGEEQQDACIWMDGSMTLFREGQVQPEQLLEQGAWQVFSFGPGLVDQGQVIVTTADEVGKAMANNPRTVIAMVEPRHYLFVVANGRTQESKGPSLYQMACFLKELGAVTAYNLDGGGSSTLVFQDDVRNFPTTNGRYQERAVSDIVFIRK